MRTTTALAACTLAGSIALSLPASAQTGAPNLPPVLAAAQPRIAVTGTRALAVPAVTTTVKAAQVQIADDEAHAPYKEGVFSGCTVAGVCTVAFSAVPAGHRRIVEHLSCSVYVASSGALRYVAFLASNFTAPREFYPYTRSVADAGQYFVHAPTLFPFEAGETPLVYAFADAQPIQELTCTATGRDITL
jgi:hypothetical protein